jgi:hypothetical protein
MSFAANESASSGSLKTLSAVKWLSPSSKLAATTGSSGVPRSESTDKSFRHRWKIALRWDFVYRRKFSHRYTLVLRWKPTVVVMETPGAVELERILSFRMDREYGKRFLYFEDFGLW